MARGGRTGRSWPLKVQIYYRHASSSAFILKSHHFCDSFLFTPLEVLKDKSYKYIFINMETNLQTVLSCLMQNHWKFPPQSIQESNAHFLLSLTTPSPQHKTSTPPTSIPIPIPIFLPPSPTTTTTSLSQLGTARRHTIDFRAACCQSQWSVRQQLRLRRVDISQRGSG